MRVLFLDIDGVLTTRSSRTLDYWRFGLDAIEAMRHLLARGKPDLCVVHSTWRKLPEAPEIKPEDTWWFAKNPLPVWSHSVWRAICQHQGLTCVELETGSTN